MAKTLDLKMAGLWTAPNDNSTPPGAWDVGDNMVIDQTNLAEPRRGFETEIDNDAEGLASFQMKSFIATDRISTTYDLITYRLDSNTQDGRLLKNDRDTISGDNRFLPPAGAFRPRMTNWGRYIYCTSDQGIKRYSAALNSSVPAGIPQALDLLLSLDGASGFFTSNEVASVTATVTDASPSLTQISDEDITNFFIGQLVKGTGIVPGTKVQDVSLSTPAVIHDATLTGGDDDIVVASDAGIVVGQIVSGQGIQANTRVLNIAGGGPYTITLSLPVIETATGRALTFSTDNIVTLDANASIMGGPSEETIALSNGSQIAYRLVWGFRNENDQDMVGAPSAFTVITNNTGETRNVEANATIPAGISTDNFYQLYRSVETPTEEIVPADQMQLVAEGVPSAMDISAGYITILDQTPNSLKGEALYTGADVEGISQSNFRPPTAVDMAVFQGYTLYANFTDIFQLKLVIDGVGAPSGVQIGDDITISEGADSFVLEAAAAEDAANGEFQVFTSGTPAQNIADTAASFIRVLNRFSDNTLCYAQLLSGPGDLPGQILLEARPGAGAFEVISSANGTAWTPNIDTTQTAEAETISNGILISKYNQPEAVPRVNLRRAGGTGNKILRVIPLRDYVIVLTSEGCYRLTGRSLNTFEVEPFDLTVQLVGPETATTLANECWCLSTQGVISISDGGVRIRSGLQINNVLQRLIEQAPNSVAEFSFGIGYDANQRYILALPEGEGVTVCSQQYCYNFITDKWTRWTRNCTAGYLHQANGLFLANGSNSNVVLERKTGNFTDYVDESLYRQIVSFDGYDAVLDSVQGLTVGDLLWQDQSGTVVYSEIVAIDFPSNTVTVAQEVAWVAGTDPEDTRVLQAISCAIQWKPVSAGDPTEAKQLSEGQLVFRRTRFASAIIKFATDLSPGFDDVTLTGQLQGSWGLFPWGEAPWGGVSRPNTLRFYIPQDKQYAGILIPRLEIRSGYANFQLEGLAIVVFDIGYELGGPGPGGDG